MQPTAVLMQQKLRILVPVKRVIDYAVCTIYGNSYAGALGT